MQESLLSIAAEKYRVDVAALARVLGGFAADWLDQMNGSPSAAAPTNRIRPATVRLTAEIMARLETRLVPPPKPVLD